MRVWGFATALFVSSNAVAASQNCVLVQNDLDRLACYDREAGRTPKQESLAAPAGIWSVRKETSKLTDQTNIYMTVDSEEVIDCGWNKGAKIQLTVRCREGKTSIIFNTGCHMTSSEYSNYGHITYRLDSEKAQTVKGNASTDNRALGLWSGGEAIPVIKRMFGKSQMIVRMMPFSEGPFTATFNISGLEKTIEPLKQACSW